MKSFYRSVILLAIAAILPLCAFAAFAAVTAWRQERAGSEREAVVLAEKISILVDRELTTVLAQVEMLAQLPGFDPGGDLATIDQMLRRLQTRQAFWNAALVAKPDGTIVVDTLLPVPGKIVEMASLEEVFRTRTRLVGNVGRGNVSVGIPIRAPVIRNDEVPYAITVVIKPDAIRDFLLNANIPNDWIGAVTDRQGTLAARTRGDEALIGHRASAAVLTANQRGGGGIYHGVTLEGVDAVSAYKVSPETGWAVHIGIPRTVYDAPVTRRLWQLTAGAAGALLLGAALAALLIREVMARRREATQLERLRRMEALGRLTGGVAHDFNNLLMVISGGIERLSSRLITPEAAQVLDRMKAATQRGAQAVQQLLLFAKGGESPRQTVDVNDRVRATLGLLKQSLPASVKVTVELAQDISRVQVDPLQLDLALLNLTTNSREAITGEGSLVIRTSARAEDGKQWVVLAVEDDGKGIDGKQLPHVFEPFFSTKDKSRGGGLGLSQVYGMATASGGTVEIESTPGKGTVVRIVLPSAISQPSSSDPSAGSVTADLAQSKNKLLVVDDDADVRLMMADYLRDLSFEITEAGSAPEALEKFSQDKFDLIITDIVMPGALDGVGLARAIKESNPDLPVILVSGFNSAEGDLSASGWKILKKPFELERLGAAVSEALKSKPRT